MVNFGQLKDLYKMQREARQMQKQMKQVAVKGESRNELVEVEMNGLQEVADIYIDDELLDVERKKDLLKSLKEAIKKAQKNLQKELMKDMDVDRLRGMIGS